MSRIDPTINASVVPPAEIGTANGYSIRWSGYFTPPVGGPKLFTSEVTNNAVVEIIVNGVLVSKKAGPINQVAPQIITLDAGQPYPVQVNVFSATPTTHRVVWRPLAISNWMEFQTSEVTAAVDPFVPTEITAVRTSSSTIGVYWRDGLGADRYSLYRASTANGYNYDSARFVTDSASPTYPSGFYYFYRDTGLSQGPTYFYRVKARYPNAVTGVVTESSPSYEDSDQASASAIPWDSSDPGAVTAAVRAHYDATGFDTTGHMRIAGPDGRVYDEREGSVPAPEDRPVGLQLSGQDSEGNEVAYGVNSGDDTGDSEWPNAKSGPYRKVWTNNGFTGARGVFTLPTLGSTILDQYPYTRYRRLANGKLDFNEQEQVLAGPRSPDALCLYLGVVAPSTLVANKEVAAFEAGALFQSRGAAYSYRKAWVHGALSSPEKIELTEEREAFPILLTSSQIEFDPGSLVLIESYFDRARAFKGLPAVSRAEQIDGIEASILGCFVSLDQYSNLKAKRLCSVAQQEADVLCQSLGYHPNQSRMLGAAWSQGEVTNNSSYLLWTAGRTAKEGAFPLNFLVNWSVLGPYYSETGISVRTN